MTRRKEEGRLEQAVADHRAGRLKRVAAASRARGGLQRIIERTRSRLLSITRTVSMRPRRM